MTTPLDSAYAHETELASRVWLSQPMGGGEMRHFTWAEAMDEARRMASHLVAQNYPHGTRIAIFAKNNAWWLLADLAIWMAGHVSVPVYPTLTAQSVEQILRHCGARLVFIGKLDGFARMAPGIPDDVARIRLPLGPARLARDDVSRAGSLVSAPAAGAARGPETSDPSWRDIVQKSEPIPGKPARDPDDLATIIYTSGSTGTPKGVMHSFRTMMAAKGMSDEGHYTIEDRVISYLPLAHVAERALLEIPTLLVGFHVFFADTLDTFVEDVRRARPTVFGSVPRLWLKFQAGVLAKMPAQRLDLLLKLPIVSRLVRKKILRGLGLDAVRRAISGSAPTPHALLEWYGRLGLEIREVYGMTENFAVSHMVRHGEVRTGYVGRPSPGVTARLSEDGEVLVKSPGNMVGYYQAPELTREVLDADGFLRTGDRGEVDAQGRLRITGRVKELFKTSKGKYVAPAPIENMLLSRDLIEQACVSGASMGQPFAVIVLSENVRVELRAEERLAEVRQQLTVALDLVLSEVNAGLNQHEQLEKIVIASEEWTVDNNLLTPTLKLKRAAIEAHYAERVAAWYARRERVIWDGVP